MKKVIKFFTLLFASRDCGTAPETPKLEGNSKKELWKFIIQTIISILTAILAALGASSCVHHLI